MGIIGPKVCMGSTKTCLMGEKLLLQVEHIMFQNNWMLTYIFVHSKHKMGIIGPKVCMGSTKTCLMGEKLLLQVEHIMFQNNWMLTYILCPFQAQNGHSRTQSVYG